MVCPLLGDRFPCPFTELYCRICTCTAKVFLGQAALNGECWMGYDCRHKNIWFDTQGTTAVLVRHGRAFRPLRAASNTCLPQSLSEGLTRYRELSLRLPGTRTAVGLLLDVTRQRSLKTG